IGRRSADQENCAPSRHWWPKRRVRVRSHSAASRPVRLRHREVSAIMRLSIIVGVVIAVLMFAGNAGAQQPASVRVVNRAQLLSRPDADGNAVAPLEVGTLLQVLDGDGQWYWVVSLPRDSQGRRVRGWVRASDVQVLVAAIPPSPADLQAARA